MSTRSNSVAAVIFAVASLPSVSAQEPVATEPPVQAVWKEQEVPFYFQSFTTFYSCSSLETKIKRILVALGANRDMKLRTRGCLSPHEIARMPYVEIDLVSPVEATPEALAERDKTRSTRELAARVRGESKQAAEAAAQFPAQWKKVSLSRSKLYLEPGDCELVDQLKDKVLPKLGVRIVEDGVKCAPNQLSMTQPKLVVEALFAMPKPDEK
jgi:hypothetical protein